MPWAAYQRQRQPPALATVRYRTPVKCSRELSLKQCPEHFLVLSQQQIGPLSTPAHLLDLVRGAASSVQK